MTENLNKVLIKITYKCRIKEFNVHINDSLEDILNSFSKEMNKKSSLYFLYSGKIILLI